MVKTQTVAAPNADEDEEQQELSFADGGNTEWYRWWEYRMVRMVGIWNGTAKLEHSWAVSHKAEPNLPFNLTTMSPGTQPNKLNVCSHKTRR